ncbi:MAG: T9SS type A sorting domain-containing protein [Bacteriovoracaceae bacterium]
MKTKLLSLIFTALSLPLSSLFAQKHLNDSSYATGSAVANVRSLVIKSNQIQTILYNTASVSNPVVQYNVQDFVWKGLGYAYEIGFLAGAKVPSATNPVDSIQIIIDGFGTANQFTADGDFSPDGITKWGWTPTTKHTAPASNDIANNQDPSSWPSTWSSWNGKYGKAIADMEVLYEMTDSTDAEFPYYPFPADTLRRGLGLTVESRVYQFSHPSLEDVLFTMFEIQNVSAKELHQMVGGIVCDAHIGGANNYWDDVQDFRPEHNLMYSWDDDSKGDLLDITPGYFGITLVATPAHKGLTSYAAFPFGGNNRPKNDNLMYTMLSEGSKLNDFFYSKDTNNIGDYIMMLGSGFYSLSPNQKEEFGVAYMLAHDLPSMIERAVVVEREYTLRFAQQGNPISISSPTPGQQLQTSEFQIQWSDASMNGDTVIDIYYSNTVNEQWKLIAKNVMNSGTYSWNISSLPDGIFYKLHIVKTSSGAVSYDSTGGYFTINKPGDAAPEIVLLQPKNLKSISNVYPIQWYAGDAEGDPVSIKIFYSDNEGATYTLLDEASNSGTYFFNTKKFPNTYSGKVKLEAAANGKTGIIESQKFWIGNFFTAITDSTSLIHVAGRATGKVFPGVADSTLITGDSYRITFDSTNGSLRYNVKDITTNQMKLQEAMMTSNNGTGTIVDGMRIWFENHVTMPDTGRSQFVIPPVNIKKTVLSTFAALPKKTLPIDLLFQFGSLDTNSFGDYIAPLDSFPSTSGTSLVKTPFRIINITDTTQLSVRIYEFFSSSIPFRKKGRWDLGESIILIVPPATNVVHASVTFSIADETTSAHFNGGEEFYLYTKKSFTTNDIYEFTADIKYGKPTSVSGSAALPKEFALEQNYPNPFNPETTIRFSLTQPGRASLKIYDAIGREVRTLFDDEMKEGIYTVVWNGNNQFNQPVSSGIYFYRLHSGSYSSTKKMVIMR